MRQIELTSKLVLALIAATVVVFSAMTVPSVVAQTTSSPPIRANSVTSGSIKDGEVKTQDLANDAVTSEKIKNGEVKAEDIADGVIPSGNIELGTHIVTESRTLSPNSGFGFGAECEEGDLLTGGGFFTAEGVEVNESAPSTFDSGVWLVQASNPTSTTFTVYAYAVCLDLTP